MEKLLIGQFDSHQIFHLFLSIVNNTNHFTLLRNYFLNSLAYLTVIYPGASRDIIENYMGKDETSPIRDLISDVVSNLAEYQEKVKTTRH